MIRKSGGSYGVVSKSGKRLGGGYRSRKQAANRLRQVEYFKHRDRNRSSERDYKDIYKKYHASKKRKKYRAALNRYNHKKGTYGNGDGKDASHKGGKIAGFESERTNRGRK